MAEVRLTCKLVAGVLLWVGLVPCLWGQASDVGLPAEWLLPSWQRANEVVPDAGKVDWTRLSPRSREVWEQSVGKGDCIVDGSWLEGERGPRYPRQSLDELVRESLLVITAVVDSQEAGFFFGDPATELRARVLDVQGRDRPLISSVAEEVRVIYPVASIETERGVLCRTSPGFERRPTEGQVVILFIRPGAQTSDPNVFIFSYSDWAWEAEEGLVFPFGTRRRAPIEAPGTVEDLSKWLRGRVRLEGGRQ